MTEKYPEWLLVTQDKAKYETTRLKVEGGYLYHHKNLFHCGNGAQQTTSMCFVPDVDLQRYQAHLRDAYNQGFKDGKSEQKNGSKSEDIQK